MTRFFSSLLVLAAVSALFAQSASAADPLPLSGTGTAPTLRGDLNLSLADAISMGLENNLDIEIARHEPILASQDTKIAWGAYDPTVSGEVGYRDIRDVSANALAGNSTNTETVDGSVGLSGLVPYLGATLEISWLAEDVENDAPFTTLSPTYRTSLSFDATIPLARNLIWNAPWTTLKSNQILEGRAAQGFRQAVMNAVSSIEAKYWELVANTEQERVAVKSRETAVALLEQVQTQYDVGVVSKVEVIEAEAGVAERDVNLIRASNQHQRSQDELIDLVLGPHLTAASALSVVPSDRPEDYVEYRVDVETAVGKAFTRRPELEQARLEVDRQQLQLRFSKNQRLPQVDLQARYATGGLRGTSDGEGTPFDPTPATTTGTSIADTYPDYFKRSGNQEYLVRGVVSFPLGNYGERHTVRKTQFELRRAEKQLARARQDIILEVRNGARDLQSAQEGIEAAQRRQAAAAEQLRAERIRLEHGESTPFDVLQRESDLVEAESQKIDAFQQYRVSVTELERAQGTILETRNIVIDEVTRLR